MQGFIRFLTWFSLSYNRSCDTMEKNIPLIGGKCETFYKEYIHCLTGTSLYDRAFQLSEPCRRWTDYRK